MRLAIRPARVDDAARLSALMVRTIRNSNANDYPADVIALLLGRHTTTAVAAMIATRRVILASEGERIIGTVALEGSVLRGLFVEMDRQRLGHARTLVQWIEDMALRQNLATLSLRSSITAHGFYERLGYRTQSFGFDSEGSTYLMTKRLQPDHFQTVWTLPPSTRIAEPLT